MKIEVTYTLELDSGKIKDLLRKRILLYYKIRTSPKCDSLQKENALLNSELDLEIRKFMADAKYTQHGIRFENLRFNTLDVVTSQEEATALAPLG